MADGQGMMVADVVAQVRDGRLEDFVREAVALVARELMEAEVSAEIGAELGEVAPERRLTHRNGYRPRGWETRVGIATSRPFPYLRGMSGRSRPPSPG